MGKWNEQKIINEIEVLIKKNGKFPSAKYLQKSLRWDLFRAIANFGGFYYFRNLFDCKITPHGYWRENYKIEIEKMFKNFGRFPSAKEIKENSEGLFDFLFSSGLLNVLREEYNYKPLIKPIGYWNNFENLKQWLFDNFGEMIKMGCFPSSTMISDVKGGRGIATSVIRKHGGFFSVATAMGCKPIYGCVAPDGHYLDSKLELIVDWYLWSRNITHEVHGLIAQNKKYKYDFKLSCNFYVEVWGMVGRSIYDQNKKKKEKLYADLGLNLISIEASLFQKSFLEIEKSLDKIFSKYNFDISKKIKGPMSSLEDILSRGKGYWTYENTLSELKFVIEKLGKFPSVSELRKIGKCQIQRSMQKYGGQNRFRSALGFELTKQGK